MKPKTLALPGLAGRWVSSLPSVLWWRSVALLQCLAFCLRKRWTVNSWSWWSFCGQFPSFLFDSHLCGSVLDLWRSNIQVRNNWRFYGAQCGQELHRVGERVAFEEENYFLEFELRCECNAWWCLWYGAHMYDMTFGSVDWWLGRIGRSLKGKE